MAALEIPSLERICIEVVAAADYWRVQRRHIQYLPEHAANLLLHLLLWNDRLQSPVQLDVFRHSVTQLHINGRQLGLQIGAEWVAYIAGLSQLRCLSLLHAPRLRDKALTPLTRLTGSLTALELNGCIGITRRSCEAGVLGTLSKLRRLGLADTSVRPPILASLAQLTDLTHLDLGGCEASDDDITCHITSLQLLQSLILWGAEAGDACIPYLAQLPHLQQLNMAWSQITAVIPLFNSLRRLDLSHCKLEQSFEGSWQAAAAAEAMVLQELVLVQCEVTPGCCEVLEAVIRSSSPTLQLLDLTSLSAANHLLPLLLALEAATALQVLSLSGTHLADDYCPSLVHCTALRTLDLSRNPDVTAAGLAATLPGLQQLQQLNLAGTGVADDVLPVLWQLVQLQQLVLADTAVTWEWEWVAPGQGRGDGGSNGTNNDIIIGAVAQQQQQQQQQAEGSGSSSTGTAGDSASSGGTFSTAGWQQLQLLDLSNTQISDAGCVQLAKQLTAAAAAVDNPRQDSWHNKAGGLRVLLVGSSRSRLGRKGVAAMGQISSLQQLILHRCQLVDRDMSLLAPLQQLQQLHIHAADPWLLSDAALLDLGQQQLLPSLASITRDGKQLLTAHPAAAVGGVAGVAGGLQEQFQQQQHSEEQQQLAGGGTSWLSGAAAALRKAGGGVGAGGAPLFRFATPSFGSIRPGNDRAVTTPAARQRGAAAAAAAGGGLAAPGLLSPSPTAGSAGATASRRSSSSSAVYCRLSDYDERYRYSMEQLLGLRSSVSQVQHPGGSGDDMGSGRDGVGAAAVGVGGQQWQGLHALPVELRAGFESSS